MLLERKEIDQYEHSRVLKIVRDVREMYGIDSSEVESHVRSGDGPRDGFVVDLDTCGDR